MLVLVWLCKRLTSPRAEPRPGQLSAVHGTGEASHSLLLNQLNQPLS